MGFKLSRSRNYHYIDEYGCNQLFPIKDIYEYIQSIVAVDLYAYQEAPRMTSISETMYDVDDSSKKVTREKFIEYENTYGMEVASKEVMSITGEKRMITKKYPFDYKDVYKTYEEMCDRNIICPVVEQVKKEGDDIETITTLYRQTSHKAYLPLMVQRSRNSNPIETEITYDSYDSNGNVVQYTIKNGLVVTVFWGYGKMYPVAKIVSDKPLGLGTVSVLQSIIDSHSFSSSDMRNDIQSDISFLTQQLRPYISCTDCQVGLYTYKPLVGMTSETSCNADTEALTTRYYRYDGFGHLSEIIDDEGNVINKYKRNIME